MIEIGKGGIESRPSCGWCGHGMPLVRQGFSPSPDAIDLRSAVTPSRPHPEQVIQHKLVALDAGQGKDRSLRLVRARQQFSRMA